MLIYLERYEEALESCDRAIAIYPDDQEAWIFRGVALQRLGRFKLAYASYEHATSPEQA
ncbi:MAG: tetratricopeptide repeat protein [Leptodesmis sp.]